MTPTQILADIERGQQIVQEIAALKAELRDIESRLKSAAEEGPHVPLQDADREGKQCILRTNAVALPVRFTSDSLIASFAPDSPKHHELLDIVGIKKLPLFYEDVRRFERVPKDGKAFRRIAREHLEPDTFARLIHAATERTKAGIAKSTVVVAWDDMRPLELAEA